jgi:hypothetical protein
MSYLKHVARLDLLAGQLNGIGPILDYGCIDLQALSGQTLSFVLCNPECSGLLFRTTHLLPALG